MQMEKQMYGDKHIFNWAEVFSGKESFFILVFVSKAKVEVIFPP